MGVPSFAVELAGSLAIPLIRVRAGTLLRQERDRQPVDRIAVDCNRHGELCDLRCR